MSAEDVANILQRNSNIPIKEVAQIITQMQGIREPISEDEYLDILINAEETRLRQTTVSVTKGDVIVNEQRDRKCLGSETMRRKLSSTPKFYPLSHTTIGTLTFPIKSGDTKFSGGVVFDGSSYITVDHHARLIPTDKIGIAVRIKFTTLSGAHVICSKGVAPTETFILWINGNTINFSLRGSFGTVTIVSDTPLVVDTWYDIVATWISGTANLYQGTTNVGSATAVGTLNTNTDKLGIGAKGDGSVLVSANTYMSWLSLMNDELTASWVTDFVNGILDTSSGNEITTIPFIGDENPRPESSFGIVVI